MDLHSLFSLITFNTKQGTQFQGNFHTNIWTPRHKSIAWGKIAFWLRFPTLLMKKALSVYPCSSSVAYWRGSENLLKWRALVWGCGMVSGNHVELWTWGMKQGKHYRWMAGSGRIDHTPELIKPFQENVSWIQQPVHLPLMSPWMANGKSTAICHRANIRNGCGICHQPLSQTVFFFLLRHWWHSAVVLVAVTWSCWSFAKKLLTGKP